MEIGAVAMEPGGAATAPCGVAVGTGAVATETGAVAMGTGQAAMEPGGAAAEAGGAAEPRVLLPREVAARARLGWVSARGRVLRLGPVLRERPGDPELRPLREAAGTDVTHWFDPQSGEACGEQAGGLVGRALPWNAHGGGYAWHCGGAPLPLDGPPPAPAPDGSAPTLLLHFADDFRKE